MLDLLRPDESTGERVDLYYTLTHSWFSINMFPNHCKEVSVKHVSFELTPDNIRSFLKGRRAYIRTRYYVFNSGEKWAVARVVKEESNEVLQKIASVEVLALPHETSYIEDPDLEVLSASSMGSMREALGTRCVVVKGKSEHVSFFIEEPPQWVTVFDVVPPRPSKLLSLVGRALDSDLQDRYVKVRVEEIDLNSLVREGGTGTVMYPCRASGLVSGKRVLYLDETPELSREEASAVTLVGCSLSARIFKAVYGIEPRLVNMCPKDLLRDRAIQGPVLVKCCRVKEGYEIQGRVGIVPWGARAPEVAGALRAILV